MRQQDSGGRTDRLRWDRRGFMRTAAAGGGLFVGTRISTAQTEVELEGDRTGWVGRGPAEIRDETNPTLVFEVDETYELTWRNGDGATHTFAIADADGADVVGPTEQVDEEGATQTVEFTADEEMSTYYCSIHPQSMRGGVEVIADGERSADVPVVRRVSVRDFDAENYELLHTYRKRRAIEALLSDPEVNDVVSEMISSFEAYDPHTGGVDAVSVQGAPDVEISGGVDEGAFDVTVPDRQVAYGLVDRTRDALLALTVTEPRDVSWRAWEGEGTEAERLGRIRDASAVRTHLEDDEDWYPLYADTPPVTSATGIGHGGVTPVVLIVDGSEGLAGIVVLLDVREDDVGEVIDARRVERFVEFPSHELARDVVPADDSVLDEVPGVPFERRPYYTANDGVHRIEEPDRSFERAGWTIDWEPTGTHGVEVTASYRGTPVFAHLDAPVTFGAYGPPDRDAGSTLEWLFPDEAPTFAGDLLVWNVHSNEFGGPGLLDVLDFPEGPDRPEGFRLWSHYYTGARGGENQDVHSGHRFGTGNYELSYDFFADGSVVPIWRRQGPGFATAYAAGEDLDDTERPPGYGDVHHVSAFAMTVTPGGADRVEVEAFDGDEWHALTEEFYLLGAPDRIVRFRNPDGSERIDLLLDDHVEVVVARRGAREIPQRRRLADRDVETAFFHPAQYVGGESIVDESFVVWLLLDAPTGQLPAPAGITSFVTRATVTLSGY